MALHVQICTYVHPVILDKLRYKQILLVQNSTLPNIAPFVLFCRLIKHITNGTAPTISSTNRTTPTATIAPTIAPRGGAAGTGVVVVSLGCLQFPKLLHDPSFAAKTDDDNYNVPITLNK